MAFNIHDLIAGVRESRHHFLKHLKGIHDDQWDWKPYPACKSIRETLAHLVSDDRAFIAILDTGRMPDFEALEERETDTTKLLVLMNESHEQLCAFLEDRFADAALDREVVYFTGKAKLGHAIMGISSEDYYHAGQVAFIRMATDPSWDYYSAIYGNS
jgi:uncharacterized damage-inducible protein DinB